MKKRVIFYVIFCVLCLTQRILQPRRDCFLALKYTFKTLFLGLDFNFTPLFKILFLEKVMNVLILSTNFIMKKLHFYTTCLHFYNEYGNLKIAIKEFLYLKMQYRYMLSSF